MSLKIEAKFGLGDQVYVTGSQHPTEPWTVMRIADADAPIMYEVKRRKAYRNVLEEEMTLVVESGSPDTVRVRRDTLMVAAGMLIGLNGGVALSVASELLKAAGINDASESRST